MKNILSIIALSLCFVFGVSAQSTLPRWGGGPPQNDNTGRVLTYALKTVTTTTATATLYQKVNAYKTIIKVGPVNSAITDSVNVTNAYVGDEIVFIFSAGATGSTITFGNHMVPSATMVVDASSKATVSFIFDGTAWIETGRAKE